MLGFLRNIFAKKMAKKLRFYSKQSQFTQKLDHNTGF
jgi:hypothetical protein